MIEALKEEAIVNKVGGRFKLSTLIQKRLVALNAGARPLVDIGSDDKLEIIVQEILQDKIYLDMSNEVKIIGEAAQSAARRSSICRASNSPEQGARSTESEVAIAIPCSPLTCSLLFPCPAN